MWIIGTEGVEFFNVSNSNEIGEVIVGYAIEEKYRRNRYAAEALKGLTEWIFENPKALCVTADTEKTNIRKLMN
jgi:RimJ/RimL family protein N-acetyltransferase